MAGKKGMKHYGDAIMDGVLRMKREGKTKIKQIQLGNELLSSFLY